MVRRIIYKLNQVKIYLVVYVMAAVIGIFAGTGLGHGVLPASYFSFDSFLTTKQGSISQSTFITDMSGVSDSLLVTGLFKYISHPKNLSAVADSDTEVTLSWTLREGGSITVLYYRSDQYPTSPTDSNATLAYSGTGSSTKIGGLSAGTTYYFRAWGYALGNTSYRNPVAGYYTAEAGTTTTSVVDTYFEPDEEDAANGNTLVHYDTSNERSVTNHVQSTNTLTLISLITGLDEGDEYYLYMTSCQDAVTTMASAGVANIPTLLEYWSQHPSVANLTDMPFFNSVIQFAVNMGMQPANYFAFLAMIMCCIIGFGFAARIRNAFVVVGVECVVMGFMAWAGVFGFWVLAMYFGLTTTMIFITNRG